MKRSTRLDCPSLVAVTAWEASLAPRPEEALRSELHTCDSVSRSAFPCLGDRAQGVADSVADAALLWLSTLVALVISVFLVTLDCFNVLFIPAGASGCAGAMNQGVTEGVVDAGHYIHHRIPISDHHYCPAQVNVNKVWLTVSSVLLGLSFIFGNSIRNIFESVVFLFVVHPFDVGDALLVTDPSNAKDGAQYSKVRFLNVIFSTPKKCSWCTPWTLATRCSLWTPVTPMTAPSTAWYAPKQILGVYC